MSRKYGAITIAKREPNPLCEDASRVGKGVIVVSDGAGGGGLYADRWARYLTEHLPEKPIKSAEELDSWIGHIWEPYYNQMEELARSMSTWHLNKFYDEGSFATLTACWRIAPNRLAYLCYGDTVLFHYNRRSGKLWASIEQLNLFAEPPHLINCKDELTPDGCRTGELAVTPGDLVFIASDALAHYLLSCYQVRHQASYNNSLEQALRQSSRQASYLSMLMNQGGRGSYEREVLRPLLGAARRGRKTFARHIRRLLASGVLGQDDYSIAWIRI